MTGPETLTHPLKQAIDAGYERRHELLETISKLEPKNPARLAHIVMLSEVDRTIRQTKANFDLVAYMEA